MIHKSEFTYPLKTNDTQIITTGDSFSLLSDSYTYKIQEIKQVVGKINYNKKIKNT